MYKYSLIDLPQFAARELFAWSKCDHDNVAKLIGLAVFRGQLAMVSTWMDNGALPDYLKRAPNADRHQLVSSLVDIALRCVYKIQQCAQIIDGLAYLHSINMVCCSF